MQASKKLLARNIAKAQALAVSDPEKCKNARFCTHQFKEWAKLNPEEAKRIIKDRAEANRLSDRRSAKKHREVKWVEEPHRRMAHNIRSRINVALREKSWRKICATQEMLGCNWLELKAHIESLFTQGMTWKNYGEWQIDHIKPLATAKNEDEVRILNHHSNLQPLWKADNYAKSDKLDWISRQKHEG